MTLKAGDRIPDVTFTRMGANGPEPVKAKDYFAGRKIALFSVPGAYTPTCHAKHLPGFVATAPVTGNATYQSILEIHREVVGLASGAPELAVRQWPPAEYCAG